MDSETPTHDPNTPASDYSENWHQYKLLRNVFLVLWLGLIPAGCGRYVSRSANKPPPIVV